MSDLESLRRHLLGLGRVLLGYSGGVDSALLAVVGRQSLGPDRFLAVIGRSASYPESQWRSAVDLARRFDTIIDGTNADDRGEDRPGLRAADEHRVRSPLAELGWSKAAVRG